MPLLNVIDASLVFARQVKELEELEYLAGLKAFTKRLRSDIDATQLPRPKRALCLALGSLTHDNDEDQANRVASQLAAFLALLAGFGIDKSQAKIHDPMFTSSDKGFLEDLGLVSPLTAEEAKEDLICNEPTFLFLPYLPYPVFELIFAQNWKPERLKNLVIIGTKLEGWLDDDNWFRGQAKAFIPRTRKCIPMFESMAMPSIMECRRKSGSQDFDESETVHLSYGLDRLILQWIPPYRVAALGSRFWHVARKEDSEWPAPKQEEERVRAKL